MASLRMGQVAGLLLLATALMALTVEVSATPSLVYRNGLYFKEDMGSIEISPKRKYVITTQPGANAYVVKTLKQSFPDVKIHNIVSGLNLVVADLTPDMVTHLLGLEKYVQLIDKAEGLSLTNPFVKKAP